MTEQEFQKEIGEIKGLLANISKHTHHPLWRSFANGMLSGIGSIFGVAIAIFLVGWILNTVGVIPAFQQQAGEWKQLLDNLQKVR